MSLSSGGSGFIDVNDASLRFSAVGQGVVFQDGSEMFSRDDTDQTLQNVLDNGAAASVTMDLTNTGTALTTAGDIAVGSSDPEDTRLHVTGNAFITQDLYIDNDLAANVVLNVAGGINAANFFGDGGLLTNVAALKTLQEVVDVDNVSTEVVSFVNNTLALSAGGPVVIGSSDPLDSTLHVTGNIHATTDITVGTSANIGTTANIGSHANIVGDVNTQGEVIATHFHGDGSNIVNLANAIQNQILFAGQDGLANGVVGLGMTLGATPGTDANTLVMSGDFTTTNLRVTNNLQVTGTVTQIHTDNLTVTDPIVALNEGYTGDVTTGFVFNREQDGTTSNVMIAVCGVVEESGALDEHLVLARTVNSADSDTLAPSGDLEVNVFGNVTVSGNIVGEWIHGDGSNLTGLVSDLQSVVEYGNSTANTIHFANTTAFSTAGNVTLGSNIDTDTTLHVTGNVFTTGNINTGTGTSVGIGTTAQSSVLSVVGTNPYNPEPLEAGIHIGQAGIGLGSFACIELAGPENKCLIDFSRPGATGSGGQQLYRLISNRVAGDSNFEMIANDDKIALSIDEGGNVAIGGRTATMGANLQVSGNVVVYGGSQEFTNPTTDSAVYRVDYASANTLSINVVDSTPSNITALEVSNTGNIHMTQNLAVGNSVTTNVIYFGSGGSVASGGGLDLNNVVSRGAKTETGIIIETGPSVQSLSADGPVIFSGLPTSAPATTGALWNDGGVLKIV